MLILIVALQHETGSRQPMGCSALRVVEYYAAGELERPEAAAAAGAEALSDERIDALFQLVLDVNPELDLRMLCVHRTGTVPVGQPSVIIAVASPHREAAFGAARFLIDELKQSVPIWKKEHYADGEHWIGERS